MPTSSNVFLYDQSTSTTLAPSAGQTPAGTSVAVGALVSNSGSSTSSSVKVSAVSPASGFDTGGRR